MQQIFEPTPKPTGSTERLHALDNLRAVMMWLGIVLHAAAIYMVVPSPIPWHDTQSSVVADILVVVIHSFRMPVFFILAGFFVMLLVRKRGTRGMLKNRLQRLGLPFVLLWPALFIACIVLALLFVHRMARGTWGLDPRLVPQPKGVPLVNTLHLWFLWMLIWFSVLTVVLAPLVKRSPVALRERMSRAFEWLASSYGGFALLALPLAVMGAFYKDGIVTASGAFLPPLIEWLHNGLFFSFGMALFAHRAQMLALYQARWLVNFWAGLVFYAMAMSLFGVQHEHLVAVPHFEFWFALTYNCCTWLLSLSLIGLFLRFMGRQNPALDYLAQSSYWVYLIHFPATIAFGALLYGVPLPALVKLSINVAASTLFSLFTYHLLVRSSALGQLLNGRRHTFTWLPTRATTVPAMG